MDDLDQALNRWRQGTDALVKGDPEPLKACWSHGDNVTVANPLGPPVRGWERVSQTIEHVASNVSDGEALDFEVIATHETSDLAYVVQIEHMRARLGEREVVTPFSFGSRWSSARRELAGRSFIAKPTRSCRHSQSNR